MGSHVPLFCLLIWERIMYEVIEFWLPVAVLLVAVGFLWAEVLDDHRHIEFQNDYINDLEIKNSELRILIRLQETGVKDAS